ncbi:KAP family P-loop NTPase fold protein [Methanocaldococcus sp. 16A]
MLSPDTALEDLENDRLGIKKKAEVITNFIKNRWDYLQKNNMIALYGPWGSGKSSVINHIISKLDKNEFICLKFDAWLYERDDNLPYSLLEFILDELEEKFKDKEDIKNKIEENAKKALKLGLYVLGGLAKGIKFNVKTPFLVQLLGAPEINFECDVGKSVDYFMDNNDNNIKEMSYHQKVKELKNCFKELSNILREYNKKLIVFIDELDRCEAENILSLLVSIKLFFSLGDDDKENKNIIYFVAVDKDAVSKAIKTKYGDVIKAEEYLEKIFNISFSMPKSYELKEFIKQYEFFNDDKIAEKLERFFKAINFTNPRHLKKVLNKYAILTEFKNSKIDDGLIPEIIRIENGERKGYLLDTVFVLYFIILYEFYYEKYLEVKRYKYRVENLKYISRTATETHITSYFNISGILKISKMSKEYFMENVIIFNDLMDILRRINDTNYDEFIRFVNGVSIFLSCIGDENIDKETNFTERYSKAGITVKFWDYIKNNYKDLIENYSSKSNYPFTNLFKMVETFL